ncbi:MAG: type I-G CRISPR-associated RAMP protein Csb1/Cas7g [Acidimicrobiales bacterium]
MQLETDRLIAACGDDSFESGILMEAELEPLAGAGAPVKPAVYAGARYQLDERWVGEGADRAVAKVVVIDNVPSQANRLEAALESLLGRVRLPGVTLDLSQIGSLPPHLPTRLSGLRFPHRSADAYLRDSELDGVAFDRTQVGAAILAGTADSPLALFEWFPQALLFGFWQSHLGKKRSQAKLARSWVSEIVGIRPGSVETRTLGVKGDPLNLSGDEKVVYQPEDLLEGWELAQGVKKSGGSKKQESLSEIGHGQVPFRTGQEAPAGISCQTVMQRATVSFAGLRRVWCGSPEANATGRALLASLGLLAHVSAFGRSFSLRSGCELRPVRVSWTWLGSDSDDALELMDQDSAVQIFNSCVAAAEDAGLPVGTRWSDPMTLTPNKELVKVIRSTWPVGG